MNLNSIVQQRGTVCFPAFLGERVYMTEFRKANGLPVELERWQPTVDAMLDGVDAPGSIFIMIDQSQVRAGQAQRRPGVHIDGYWNPAIQAHGGGGHHGSAPCRGKWDSSPSWLHCDFREPEALILAANVTASRAFSGAFAGTPGEGGDFSHLDLTGLQEHRLEAGTVYAGNVTMLHESLAVQHDCLRTLVRLSVPGWEPRA